MSLTVRGMQAELQKCMEVASELDLPLLQQLRAQNHCSSSSSSSSSSRCVRGCAHVSEWP
jgi:hypothetical protein